MRSKISAASRWSTYDGVAALRTTVVQLHAAARQVAHAGTPELVDRAVRILSDARKELYLLLAGD